MSNYVRSIEASSIHGRFDFKMDFGAGINIVYGKNGSGKTTLVHIIANILNGEFDRFVFLPFNSITVELDEDIVVVSNQMISDQLQLIVEINNSPILKLPVLMTRELMSDRRLHRPFLARERKYLQEEDNISEYEFYLRERAKELEGLEEPERIKALLPAAYFPAFRTMIDAWASVQDESESRRATRAWSSRATGFARKWFGQFLPTVNYPSLLEIEQRITEEVQHARLTIGRADRELLLQAFLQIFESLSKRPEKEQDHAESILQEIRSLFLKLEESPLQVESTLVTSFYLELSESIHNPELVEESERTAVRVLNVYRELLEKVVNVQERSFSEIQQYLESVNKFLEGKQLIVDPTIPSYHRRSVGIGFDDGTSINQLHALSSGERQIVTLIFAATHMSEQKVVLIDEPEISLHVDWQRRLLGEMAEQIGDRQIIACTHSPVVGADYEDFQKEIELTSTNQPLIIEKAKAIEEEEELPF